MSDAHAAPAATEAAPAKSGSFKLYLLIGGVVLILIVLQVVLFLMFFSGSEEAASEEEGATAVEEEEETEEYVELAIGTGFNVTNTKAAPGTTINVDFKIVSLISEKDHGTFEEKLHSHDGRIHQSIMKVIRSSSLDDLSDPNLTNLRRLIREEINKILRGDFVGEIVFSEFSYMEH